MEEKYSYLSTIMKFKESCFGLNGIKKLLIKKILKSLLTIIVLIVAALTIFYIMFVFSESKIAINELIKIATTNDSKVVILWLMFGIIVLYIFADAKITIDDRIEKFKRFINGLDPTSLAVQLNKMDRDGSVFRGIVKQESKRLIKIAEGLGGFNEILKSYIIGAEKKARDLQAQTSKS